ncbi:hypothetical protein DFH09DRAFT_913978, partial [Mycena vulgaris]
SAKEAGDYKYVLDVDGNGWSGRFQRLMTSIRRRFLLNGSSSRPSLTNLGAKFSDRIAPWLGLSDLHDALVFFRGDLSGAGAHDVLARKIAAAGRDRSKTFWRKEDMVNKISNLTLEYVRLMSEDREAMSYKGDGVSRE